MVDYRKIFKKFYDDCIALSGNVPTYISYHLEKGLSLCILKKYLTSDDIAIGEELSIKEIFKILNINTDEDNIDLSFFTNYVVLKLKKTIKILSVPKRKLSQMTQVCTYDNLFVINDGYESFIPLFKLAEDLDIPLYGAELYVLKSRFKNLIDSYINENLNELLLLGCVDTNNNVASDFKPSSELKNVILQSDNKHISIYTYLKEHYININLFKYIDKYTLTKKSQSLMNKLLVKHKRASLVLDSELLSDNIKNDFKVNIERIIAQRRALEIFINTEWKEKKQYDMIVDYNKEAIRMIEIFDKIIERRSDNIIIKKDNKVLFDSNSVRSFCLFSSLTSSYTKIGQYSVRKSVPVIECFNQYAGVMCNIIKFEPSSDRKEMSIHENGIQVYPVENC